MHRKHFGGGGVILVALFALAAPLHAQPSQCWTSACIADSPVTKGLAEFSTDGTYLGDVALVQYSPIAPTATPTPLLTPSATPTPVVTPEPTPVAQVTTDRKVTLTLVVSGILWKCTPPKAKVFRCSPS